MGTKSNKVYYTWKDVEHMIMVINNLMYADNWRPDYIVGITRGGLPASTILSNMTNIPMYTLDVRFRDNETGLLEPESNSWMANDAFGYNHDHTPKNILIVDDINDSGKTLEWIKKDWRTMCQPSSSRWDEVWGQNVRFATLIDNDASSFNEVDYTAQEINKAEDPTWIVFPWEGERNYGKA